MFQKNAQDYCTFSDASPTPYHTCQVLAKHFIKAGFHQLSENQTPWKLVPGGKYFFTRNRSTIVAFAVGNGYDNLKTHFRIIGAHSDSCCLKVKPVSHAVKSNHNMVNVETYGGGLWHTWFDRDLGVSGLVLTKNPESQAISSQLVSIKKPILRVPSLAIHLNRNVQSGFIFNTQTHLAPILSTVKETTPKNTISSPGLSKAILKELKDVDSFSDVISYDLCLHDTQNAAIGGVDDEFIFAPRLDNQVSCFTGMRALIGSFDSAPLSTDSGIRLFASFDHEEVGSSSTQGAASNLVLSSLKRIIGSLPGTFSQDTFSSIIRRSFMVSADNGHAIHPNYADKHDSQHTPPIMNKGPIFKYNVNQRYATTAVSWAILETIASKDKIPIQKFSNKNDLSCGSTIGPIMSTRTAIRTIDVGIPQLSMHSIRETCGTDDITHMINLMISFYKHYPDYMKVDIDSEI